MSRALYSSTEIKNRLSCVEYARSQGAVIHGDRCCAWWRNGDNQTAVHIQDDQWHDFVTKQGGSVIDLCAICECGDRGFAMKAINILGERLGLTPVKKLKPSKKSRSEQLMEDGYKATAQYDYCDENGDVSYSIVRFEKDQYKEGEHKEFVHRTKDHEGLEEGTKKLIYNLPAVIKSDEVFIVEGEKDADTLISMGIVATTNSGGAKNWQPYFTPYFKGKDVVILPDNDKPGQEHGELIRDLILPVAKSVKMITVSALPKGDVTDWIQKEGGSLQKLRDAVSDCRMAEAALSPEIAAAKLANQKCFTNYTEVKNGKRTYEEPITLGEIIADAKIRFLGYPRNLGGDLFDWNREKNEIMFINNHNALFAWVQRISKRPVMWRSDTGMVSRVEFYEALIQDAKKYSGISSAPHFPPRNDIFYTHGAFPPADKSHSTFWQLIDFFIPSNPANRTLIAAMFVSPIYYTKSATRPMWIVDTDDAQASGKTTMVKVIAELYGHTAIPIDLNQLERDSDQIIKRLISTEGRQARIALIDNATRTLGSPNLAMFITSSVISGRPAYGRGEEVRPNDLTWIATVNGASVNTDIASRSYTVRVRKPKLDDPHWEHRVNAFVDDNRKQLFSDILDMVRNNPLSSLIRKGSRFGAFDQTVLSAVCHNPDEFSAACASISGENERANEDSDHAEEWLDIFERAMATSKRDEKSPMTLDGSKASFILNRDIDYLLSISRGAIKRWSASQVVQLVRQGIVRFFDKSVDRIPQNDKGIQRSRGILYVPDECQAVNGKVEAEILERVENDFKVTTTMLFKVSRNEAKSEQ